MDKATAVRKQLNREQWKSIITECRSNGITTTALHWSSIFVTLCSINTYL